MKTERRILIVSVAAALFAIVAPVLLAVDVAKREALNTEKMRALMYARDVLLRSEKITDQIGSGIQALSANEQGDPCSESNLALMRRIDLASSYIQAIGHVRGTRFVCSSMSRTDMELGAVDIVQPAGVLLRKEVEFPFARGLRFLVVERDGYAAVIHKDLALDVGGDLRNVSLAVLSGEKSRQVLSLHGYWRPAWIGGPWSREDVTFRDDGYVIALVRSHRYAIGALAALPGAEVDTRIGKAIRTTLPVGILTGLLLAFCILYLGKMQRAMPAVIKSALKHGEFCLLYQPVVDLATGKWVGAEALLRWQRPTGEEVRPDIFISVAEDNGLIKAVTRHVIGLLAHDIAGIVERRPDFHIGVNLSAADLHDDDAAKLLGELVGSRGLRAANLMLEITERSFTKRTFASTMIRGLRQSGFLVAIDDFGTGYSSLSFLKDFEIDLLKIDKSFVDSIGTTAATSQVVPHIIEMAKALKLKTIAEGVETNAQACYLREHGVEYAQGWLFAKAMSVEELKAGLALT
jgi:sensor c-di-GMP phosphodiesterase-like protein